MTLREIERMNDDFLSVQQVAECLKCSPQLIRDQAEREPKFLGFSIAKFGHAFRIPRLAFVAWMKGETPMLVYDPERQKGVIMRDADCG